MNAFQELFRVYQSSYPIKQNDSPQTQKHFFAFAYFDEVTLYSLFIYAIFAQFQERFLKYQKQSTVTKFQVLSSFLTFDLV